MMKILKVVNLYKSYKTKSLTSEVLRGVSFDVERGEFIAIMGESGAGKTTLLNNIATLDKPTSGQIVINGLEISTLKKSQLAQFRRKELGFVFQDFNLLDQFNNRDNIFLPLVLMGIKPIDMEKRLKQIVDLLNINNLLNKYPYQISGGQKQKIAIARAIITNPSLLLADEPTGNLDSGSSENILKLFATLQSKKQTIIMVTHSLRAASYAKRILFIKDGKIYHELYRGELETQSAFMERIAQAEMIMVRGEENEHPNA